MRYPSVSDYEGVPLQVLVKDHNVTPTEYGDKRALLVDFTVLEGPDQGRFVRDSYIFYRRCVESLAPRVGSKVTGRFVRPGGRWFFEYERDGSVTEKFEATHKLRGSGYELRKEYLDGTTYVDAHGNRISVPGGAVEKVTLPEPSDGTLWRLESTGEDYFYSSMEREFIPLESTKSGFPLPVERYTEKQEKFTRMYPYGYGYPAGKMLQDCIDNRDLNPEVTIIWDHARDRVRVDLVHRYNGISHWGYGDTVEDAVQDLNLKMIE